MEIISFFSFKGGVGRTALLVNAGAVWALQGKAVVIVDMDLAAPGIGALPAVGDWINPRWEGHGVRDALTAFFRTSESSDEPFALIRPTDLLREVKQPDGMTNWPAPGRLYAIDAGRPVLYRPTSEDADVPERIPPVEGRDGESERQWNLRSLAEAWRADLAAWRTPEGREIDYVLIDCRTGYEEILDLTLGYLADRMVIVTGMTAQHRDGLERTLRALTAERIPVGGLGRLVTVVVSPMPTDGSAESQAGFDAVKETVAASLRSMGRYLREPSPAIMSVPYSAFIASSDPPFLQVIRKTENAYVKAVEEFVGLLRRPALDAQREIREALREPEKEAAQAVAPLSKNAKLRVNPLTDLPGWDWPLRLLGWDEERIAQRKREIVGNHTHENLNEDYYITAWSMSISLEPEEKLFYLSKTKDVSMSQIEQVVAVFQREIESLNGISSGSQLLDLLYGQMIRWVSAVVPDFDNNIEKVLLPQLEGCATFPSWETWPEFWFRISFDLVTKAWQPDAAKRSMQLGVDLDESDENGWLNFAILLDEWLAEPAEANLCFDNAFRLGPDSVAVRRRYAQSRLRRNGGTESVTAEITRCMAMDPANPQVLSQFALTLEYAGRGMEGFAMYRRARQTFPTSAAANFDFAFMAWQRGEQAVAIGAMSKAMELFGPDDWYVKGSAALLLRDRHQAERALAAADRRIARGAPDRQAFELRLVSACAEGRPVDDIIPLVLRSATTPFSLTDTMFGLYQLAGWRPETRENARRATATLLFHYRERQAADWGALPGFDHMIGLMRRFAEGESDGAGDPRDLPYLDRNAGKPLPAG